MSSTPGITGILEITNELDRLRKEQEEVHVEINKMHKKLQSSPEVVEKPGDTSLSKLKLLYIQAKELSESEVAVSNIRLTRLDSLLPSASTGQQCRKLEVAEGNDHKRKRMKVESDVTRVPLKGEQVAARVTADDADKDEWFVMKVIHFHRETKEYVLEFDDDEEEDGALPQRTVPFHRVVALPEGHRQ
ncbi:hypothetical protein Bca4012_059761 [Brassica carinata]